MKSSSLVEFPGSVVLNKLVPMEFSKRISTDVFQMTELVQQVRHSLQKCVQEKKKLLMYHRKCIISRDKFSVVKYMSLSVFTSLLFYFVCCLTIMSSSPKLCQYAQPLLHYTYTCMSSCSYQMLDEFPDLT